MELSEYDNIARLEQTHWWYAGMRHIAATVIRTLLLPPKATLLDAGCGVGGGLQWLQRFGTPTGFDLHPKAVAYSQRHTPRVAQASLQAIPFANQTFDVVTTFEVLYHLAVTNDADAVREMARVLKPNGWLIARVPAHDWLRGAHDRHVHTRHRYTPAELRALFNEAGLTVRRVTYLNFALFPVALLTRLLQRADDKHTDVALPSPFINAMLFKILASEATLLRFSNLPIGLSVLIVGQKKQA